MLSHRDCIRVWDFKSHQAPVPVDDTIELSEQEFEERSNKNVERWVSLHIIPVRGLRSHR
jgi:hypothetical protein